MNQLFTRLYLTFFASLLVVLALAGAAITLLADTRLHQFAQQRLQPLGELLQSSWADQTATQQNNWLDLVSNLTGTRWQFVDEKTSPTEVTVDHDWLNNRQLTVHLRLDEQTRIQSAVTNWQSLEQGYGWLFLDAISREAIDRREARFIALSNQAPWAVDRVTLNSETLSALERRQLSAGQSVRVEQDAENTSFLYLPAGEGRAIRFGPITRYRFLSVGQWLSIIGISLASLSLFFIAWVRPLDRRFRHLFEAVDNIATTRDSVRLPTEASDDLGQLARHVERMAFGLIDQVEKNRQLNQAVSHDLKTPLSRIRFSLELLDIPLDNPYRQNINRDIDQLVQLTEELLLFHQLKTPAPSQDPVDLTALIQERLTDVESELQLTTELPSQPLLAKIWPGHWNRLVDNLLVNAKQYGRGRVHLRLNRMDQGFQLSIEDNGPGLTLSQFEKLRQPFERLDDHRNLNQQNHGLGLALISAAAEHYGGEFYYQTSALGGAAMTIDFPERLL